MKKRILCNVMGNLGLTPAMLAKKSGVSIVLIKHVMEGAEIKLREAHLLAKALDVPLPLLDLNVIRPIKTPTTGTMPGLVKESERL